MLELTGGAIGYCEEVSAFASAFIQLAARMAQMRRNICATRVAVCMC